MFKKSSIICVFALSFCFAGEKVETSLSDIITKPESFLGKTVHTVGTVDHVCKHGGKKMLVFASTPEESIHIMGSDTVPIFGAEINGSDVLITGTVKENKITKIRILKMMAERDESAEKENAKPSIEEGEGLGHGEGQQEKAEEGGTDHLAELIAEMEAAGKDYISSYYIECQEFSVKK